MKRRNIILTAFLVLNCQFFVVNSQITVFTIGDSTMAPKDTTKGPERGWGMAFPLFFDTTAVKFENHARNGRSTKSFIDEGRWKTVADKLKKGDYVFIEFGHNDEKIEQEKLYAAPNGAYKDNLALFVREAREKGAFPVLMTPIVRRKFDENGILINTHGEYPDAVRSLAKNLNVPMIDMKKKSRKVVQELGDEASKKLFMWHKKDDTHLNTVGAPTIAVLAVEGIRELKLPLEEHLLPYDFQSVDAPFPMPLIKTFRFPQKDFPITKYGAKQGTNFDNTKAIAKAINACNKAGGGRVVVPAGEWWTGAIHFRSNVNLYLEEGAVLRFSDNPADYLPAVMTSWEGMECYNYSPLIYAFECENIAITGKGKLQPKMDVWKKWFARPQAHLDALKKLYTMASTDVPVEQRQMAEGENNLRPHLIHFNRCKNVLLDGFKIRDSPFWTIHIYMCDGGVARNLDVRARGHNNDGIDLEMTKNFLVENCVFDQGDDAVVIKAGRNRDAWRLNTPAENIVIRNCTVLKGHTLLGVGSEISGGIRNVYMHNCIAPKNVTRFFFIKTNHRRGGFIENIYMENVHSGTAQSLLEIDADVLYQWQDLVPTYETRITRIENIIMRNVTCDSTDVVYELKGDARLPVKNVEISNVRVKKVLNCFKKVKNAENVVEKNVNMLSLYAQQFPDGSPIPEWFSKAEPTDISTLGKQYVITDYGVENDSVKVQTGKIQAIIDTVHKNCGGVLIVPKGTFLSGSLFFRQGVHLHIEAGGTLKASDDISDFPLVTTRIEGQTLKYFAAFINADSLDGFTISGKGTLNGNGLRFWKAFWLRRQWNPNCTNMDEQRPRLLFVSNSKNVQISGICLINSPFWTSHYYKCENLKLLNLYIFAPTSGDKAPSSDAIDLDVCRNVLIKNCYMSVNDDAVCLKGGKGPAADRDPNNGENRNIIIEDNTFDNCPALTLGSESVHSYNVIMRRCTMKNALHVLLLKMRPDTPQRHEYILVEDITGTAKNFHQISPWLQFFDLKGQAQPHSSASNITVRNIDLKCNTAFKIINDDRYTLSDFTFENINLSTSQKQDVKLDFIENLVWKNVNTGEQNTRKPWTRWWWFGNAVTEQGITAALEAYREAGLGGVEITPVYGVKGEEKNFIEYLSPAWMEKLVYTLSEAKRLGLGVDMANASGWPFGGSWVTDDHTAKYFASKVFTLKGGERLADTLKYIQTPLVRTQGAPDAFDQIREEKELPLIAIVANKKGKNGFSQSIDLTDKVQNGILTWQAPEGEWLVCALYEGAHGKMVERAGPGGDGLVIDHFSNKALDNYLEKFDKAFRGYDLSYLRCFFNDSYEVDDASGEANFTPELFVEFEKRNHYRLENHLPALLGLDSDENNRRVIYDYRNTISELLLERFTIPWRDWAKRQDKQIRNQAHGSPANVLDLYAVSDIPEIEGKDIVNLKAAASAANVSGKNLVSSETATWLNEHFESTPGDVKNAVDKMFLAGVNHIFYHGTAYSPPDAPFPGWLFYAAVHFTPQNTLWDCFGTLNKYVANVQKYLQAGKPSNDILLYFPVADLWSEPATNGAFLQHFHSDRLFNQTALKECGDYLTRSGFSWDAVSDRQLQNNDLQTYKAVFVPETNCMDVMTFEKLLQTAQNGTKVFFYKKLPEDVPGAADLKKNKELFNRLLNAAKKSPDIIITDDLSAFEKLSGIHPENYYKDSLQSVRRQKEDGGYYYFIKNCGKAAFENYIPLNADFVSAHIFNPMSGKSGFARIRKTDGKNEIYLQLKTEESLIIETFNEKRSGEAYPFYAAAGEKTALSGKWTVEFVKGGPVLPPPLAIDNLVSWTDFGEEYAAFSGTAEYKTLIPAMNNNCDAWLLDLGTVNSSASVYLNGDHLQTLIQAPFTVEIPARLLKGDDTLTLRIANLMANRIASMDKKDIPYRIFYNTNFNALNKQNRGNDGKFTAKHWQPKKSGISGTVTLTPLKKTGKELPDSQDVLYTMQRVNQYFMDKYDYYSPSNVGKLRPSNIWTRGVYYEGLMALYKICRKEEYYQYALKWAEFHRWGLRNGNTTRNADDQCCGQTYLDLYQISPAPEKIHPIKSCMDMLADTPQNDDWSWIDAIQMAMPVFARLGKMTGDNRYFEKMYQMYMFTRNRHGGTGLFNPKEGLWWRDADFVPPYKEPNGRNCYWSRGNGWVYAALAQVLSIIPADEPHREEYISDFVVMSNALKDCQREDGFWNVSLHDPTHFGGKESTGTSLFVYGMAYGINNGILDRETWLPVVSKAWAGLCNDAVHPNGFLGYVQGTGKEPKDAQPVTSDIIPDFEDFGIGCFLLGASEMFQLSAGF